MEGLSFILLEFRWFEPMLIGIVSEPMELRFLLITCLKLVTLRRDFIDIRDRLLLVEVVSSYFLARCCFCFISFLRRYIFRSKPSLNKFLEPTMVRWASTMLWLKAAVLKFMSSCLRVSFLLTIEFMELLFFFELLFYGRPTKFSSCLFRSSTSKLATSRGSMLFRYKNSRFLISF